MVELKICTFLDPSKVHLNETHLRRITKSKVPKIGPRNSPKIVQIAVIVPETDSCLDSLDIHMKFVQIFAMQVLKRKMKSVFFWNAFKTQLIPPIPAGTLFIKNVKRVAILAILASLVMRETTKKPLKMPKCDKCWGVFETLPYSHVSKIYSCV